MFFDAKKKSKMYRSFKNEYCSIVLLLFSSLDDILVVTKKICTFYMQFYKNKTIRQLNTTQSNAYIPEYKTASEKIQIMSLV